MLGSPDTVVELGNTEVTEEIFMDYLSSLGENTYRCVSQRKCCFWVTHLIHHHLGGHISHEHNIAVIADLDLRFLSVFILP